MRCQFLMGGGQTREQAATPLCGGVVEAIPIMTMFSYINTGYSFFFFFFFFMNFTFQLNSYIVEGYTLRAQRSSGQAVVTGRCRPFSPPVLAFNYFRASGSAFPLLLDFHRMLLTHALLVLSANQLFYARKSPHE